MEKQVLILIVEDDALNSELLEVLLKRKNLPYLLASNGKEAISVFEQHPEIDLVLLDIKLPLLTGEEVLKKNESTTSTYSNYCANCLCF